MVEQEQTDENLHVHTSVVCSTCKTEVKVQVLDVNNEKKIDCPACKTTINLKEYNPDSAKVERKNQKEWDKLKKLLND